MTAPRSKVAASLAEMGRPLDWANEQQAAVLSGVGPTMFRRKVKSWEKRGFPQINPENGKRSIPGILAFWNLPSNHLTASPTDERVEDESTLENWHGKPEGKRLAS